MKKLLTIGDSFTAGKELPSQILAWPVLLANKLGWSVTNLGESASCNQKMMRKLVSTPIEQYDLIVILWSHFDRFEIADDVGIFDAWPGGNRTFFRNEAPWRPIIIDYWNRHYNDDYAYRQYLMNVILAQSYIKSHGKKYIMADAFGNHENPGRHAEINQDLLGQIDSYNFLGWPNKSTFEWVGSAPRGSGGHYLEEGHEIVAEKFYQHATNMLEIKE